MLIKVTKYQSHWPEQYEAVASALRKTLADRVISIDHIGSTAVPGLAAKPVIDIQISVSSLDVLNEIQPLLNGVAFLHRPDASDDRPPPWESKDPFQWEKAFFRTPDGVDPRIHIHIREFGRRNQRYAILFRDYLRANSRARDAYGTYKLLLSELTSESSGPGGTGAYLDMKDPVLDLIADAAEKWSSEVEWRPKLAL